MSIYTSLALSGGRLLFHLVWTVPKRFAGEANSHITTMLVTAVLNSPIYLLNFISCYVMDKCPRTIIKDCELQQSVELLPPTSQWTLKSKYFINITKTSTQITLLNQTAVSLYSTYYICVYDGVI